MGGGLVDIGFGIAVDPSYNIYVTGMTNSDNFPLKGPAQPFSWGGDDAFVVMYDSARKLKYATLLGGSGQDWGNAIAVDYSPAEDSSPERIRIHVTGFAGPNFHTKSYSYNNGTSYDVPYKMVVEGVKDAFVCTIDPTHADVEGYDGYDSLLYSTLLGGTSDDEGRGIAVNDAGDIYVAGWSLSTGFTGGLYHIEKTWQDTRNGASGSDAFVSYFRINSHVAP